MARSFLWKSSWQNQKNSWYGGFACSKWDLSSVLSLVCYALCCVFVVLCSAILYSAVPYICCIVSCATVFIQCCVFVVLCSVLFYTVLWCAVHVFLCVFFRRFLCQWPVPQQLLQQRQPTRSTADGLSHNPLRYVWCWTWVGLPAKGFRVGWWVVGEAGELMALKSFGSCGDWGIEGVNTHDNRKGTYMTGCISTTQKAFEPDNNR